MIKKFNENSFEERTDDSVFFADENGVKLESKSAVDKKISIFLNEKMLDSSKEIIKEFILKFQEFHQGEKDYAHFLYPHRGFDKIMTHAFKQTKNSIKQNLQSKIGSEILLQLGGDEFLVAEGVGKINVKELFESYLTGRLEFICTTILQKKDYTHSKSEQGEFLSNLKK